MPVYTKVISQRFSQCNLSVFTPVHVYFADESSASSKVRLLHKDTMFRELHLNRGNKLPQIAPNRSCGLYVRFSGCNFGLTNIALRWDVTKTGNGEWGMGNGEWGMGNGEWGMGNGEWEMGNGKWEIENGKLKMGN